MGRHKEYERADLIERATELFRDHGYAGASTAMLVANLQVNKNSLYSEFGSKQALFNACLEHYNDTNVAKNFGPLELPDANVEQIREVFEFFAGSASGPARGRGCLFCNTAVEYGPDDPSGRRFVQRYFTRIFNAFMNALENANSSGRLVRGIDAREEAQSFTASVLGMFVMIRAKARTDLTKGAANAAIRRLKSICE
jgi:AcrR family transcriptional regulator